MKEIISNSLANRMTVITSKTASGATLTTYWKKDQAVKKHIASGKGPELDIINATLFEQSLVTDRHMELCANIVSSSVTVPLPVPNTPHSKAFTAIGGVGNPWSNRSLGIKFPGCYRIILDGDSYVGQAQHLGKRVREHASLAVTSSLSSWLQGQEATVQVFNIPSMDSYHGLNLVEFLCVLELYLMILYNPTKNKTFVPTPGVMHTPESIKKMMESTALSIRVYEVLPDGSYNLLIEADNTREFSRQLGVGKSFFGNLFTRSDGWYRKTILFTREVLVPNATNSMSMDEFKIYFDNLKKSSRFNKP